MEKKKNGNIFENMILAVAIMLFFITINFAYYKLEESTILFGIKITSIVLLFLSIAIFEIAYKKDNGKIGLYGIEILVLASHAMSIAHIVQLNGLQFTTYILISAFTFVIYYILKIMILYTIEKRKYLSSLSDIKEIVNNEPTKKEAKKRVKKGMK